MLLRVPLVGSNYVYDTTGLQFSWADGGKSVSVYNTASGRQVGLISMSWEEFLKALEANSSANYIDLLKYIGVEHYGA